MAITLETVPKQPIIIQGFPGYGLIGSIVTEFLVNSPQVKSIGHIFIDDMPPVLIIHEGKMLHPAGLYYNEQYNLLIIHTLAPLQGLEWKFSDQVIELYKKTDASLLVSIEGVASQTDSCTVYGFTNDQQTAQQRLVAKDIPALQEGILLGLNASLTLRAKQNDLRMLGLYATTHSQLPDSVAAAQVIKTLDRLFDFNIDPTPLLSMAKEFEEKIKDIMLRSSQAIEEKDNMNYVG